MKRSPFPLSLLLLAGLLLALPVQAQSQATADSDQIGDGQTAASVGIRVVEYGIYKVKLLDQNSEQELTGETMHQVAGLELVSSTTSVPLHLGTQFGYRYELTGPPPGTLVDLSFELHHPLMISDQGDVLTADSFSQTVTVGDVFHDLFVFENKWELEPGEYLFKVFHENQLINTFRFEAYE